MMQAWEAMLKDTINPKNLINPVKKIKKVLKVGKVAKKIYQTYTKTNKKTWEVYTGRTSWTGSPTDNIKKRDANHHMNSQWYWPAKLDKSSSNKDAIRWREQELIDINWWPKSKWWFSWNAINGISDKNKKRDHYLNESKKEFWH